MRRGSAGGPALRMAGQQRTGGEPAAALKVAYVLVQAPLPHVFRARIGGPARR